MRKILFQEGTAGTRLIAIFEFVKGLLVLLVGLGGLSLMHRDIQALGDELVRRLHLNPAHHYPRIFLEAAGRVTDLRLWILAGAAVLYAAIRFAEAYGLWHDRKWAEWFAVISGSMYLPAELYEMWRHPSIIHCVVLVTNIAIVWYLVRRILQKEAIPVRENAPMRMNAPSTAGK